MALADLVARLEQDAQGQVEAIAARTEAEVRAIHASARQAAADATARTRHQRRAERAADAERRLAAARHEARALGLAASHALIDRVLARARSLLREAAEWPAYRDVVPAHVGEALAYLEGLSPRVRCPAALVAIVQPLVSAHEGALLVVDDSIGPGVVARARDGSVEIDNTLDARLSRVAAQFAPELLLEVRRVAR